MKAEAAATKQAKKADEQQKKGLNKLLEKPWEKEIPEDYKDLKANNNRNAAVAVSAVLISLLVVGVVL